MSIRLRVVDDTLITLCAAKTEAREGDRYLDDEEHYALAMKFARDWEVFDVEKYEELIAGEEGRAD